MADGRYYDRNGYVRVMVDGKLVGEHRVIMEAYLGQPLKGNEVVHHINEVKDDNRIENLEVQTWSQHATTHSRNRLPEMVDLVCGVCRSEFQKLARKHRSNLKNGSQSFCSVSCAGKWKRRQQLGDVETPEHGTIGAYSRCGPPRCGPCKKAMRNWKRSRRSLSSSG